MSEISATRRKQVCQSATSSDLTAFLSHWDKSYKANVATVKLFDELCVGEWTHSQKIYFIKAFYHARGHFHDFLWYLGNHAPDENLKKIILHNISEEFGEKGKSHELHYIDFSNYFGVDIYQEMMSEENYASFLKEFNRGHLIWLLSHDWESCMAAFSAYERLDNIDYANLMITARAMGTPDKYMTFFKIHAKVHHFDTTVKVLDEIWCKNPNKVIEAFNYIASHQLSMWRSLSDAIFAQ